MEKNEIKEFSISLPIVFDNKDLRTPTDLGCVYLYSIYKTLGHGNGFEARIIVSKKTLLPITLQEQRAFVIGSTVLPVAPELLSPTEIPLILDKVAASNKDSPQEKYFMLRFSENNRVKIYTPEGKLVLLEDYDPVEANVYCGKNVIAFNPAYSDKYHFFDPTTGKRLAVEEMLPHGHRFRPKERNRDLEICIYGETGCIHDSNIVQRLVFSEKLTLETPELT